MKHLEEWHIVNQPKAAETQLRVGVIKSLVQHLKYAKEAHLWTVLCLQQHYRASGQQKHALANIGPIHFQETPNVISDNRDPLPSAQPQESVRT